MARSKRRALARTLVRVAAPLVGAASLASGCAAIAGLDEPYVFVDGGDAPADAEADARSDAAADGPVSAEAAADATSCDPARATGVVGASRAAATCKACLPVPCCLPLVTCDGDAACRAYLRCRLDCSALVTGQRNACLNACNQAATEAARAAVQNDFARCAPSACADACAL